MERMNKDNKFDDLIKSKLDNDELHYPIKGWEKMQDAIFAQNKTIDEKIVPFVIRKNKWKSIISIASCIVILIGAGFISLQNYNIEQQQPNNNTAKQVTTATNINLEHTNNSNPIIKKSQAEEHLTYQPNNNRDEANNSQKNISERVDNSYPQYNLQPNTENIQITNNVRETHLTREPNHTPRKTDEEIDYLLKQYIAKGFEDKASKPTLTSKDGFEIGVNGGINYGTLNQGYAMGVVAKTNISKDVFIDGTIGVNFSNKTDVPVYSVSGNKVLARPGKNQSPINSPAITNESNQLIYLQFNPSVGYQVAKNISFSIGGDIQQQINRKSQSEENVVYYSKKQNAEIIPSSDFGFTTKTEFKISKSIIAGLMYREGLNSYFATAENGVNYANRRYVQIQLKYNISL